MEELFKELLSEIKKLNQSKERIQPVNDYEPVDRTRLVSDDAKERTMKQVFMDYMASQNPSQVIAEMSQALDQYEDENNIPEEMELSEIDPTFIKEVEDITADFKAGKLKKKEKPTNNNNFVLEKKEDDSKVQIVSEEELNNKL